MKFEVAQAPGLCGVSILREFNTCNPNGIKLEDDSEYFYGIGTGLYMAGFINDLRCKKAYNKLVKEWKVLYQSEPRMNYNSGNMFFVTIFDSKEKPE